MSKKSTKLEGKTILLTGPTSQVAFPLARELAKTNKVVGLARFSKPEDLARLKSIGVTPFKADLGKGSFDDLPKDFDYVLNFAVVHTDNFDSDLAVNAVGFGRLMSHCRNVKALLHVSSAGVYRYVGPDIAIKETDPYGDNHKNLFPTYSFCKVAAEQMALFSAQEWGIPTTIARFSVPYGNNGGWPFFHLMMMKSGVPIQLHPEQPNLYNPIHEDDYIAHIPKLLDVADVPATVVNWGGAAASIEEWTAYIGELTGLEPKYEMTENALGALHLDLTKMRKLLGEPKVPWRDGIRRMVEAVDPQLLKK